jgi:hypothetical protein
MIASPALTVERERRRPILSERATLDPLDTRARRHRCSTALWSGSHSRSRTPQPSATPEIRSLHPYTIPEDGIAAANWVRIR